MLKNFCLIVFCLLLSGVSVGAAGFTTPEEAFQAYNDALLAGDMPGAYAILSPADRAVMTLEEFTARYATRAGKGLTAYSLQKEPDMEMRQAITNEVEALPDVQEFSSAATTHMAEMDDFAQDRSYAKAVAETPMKAAVEKPLATARPSTPQPSGSMAGSFIARESLPESRLDLAGVRVVNIITVRQESDGWYVFHNRAAEAKLEELLNEALELARHDVMENLLVARDMFAQAFAVEGFDALKDAYRQSYQYVLERIGFLAAQNAYHEQLTFTVAEVVPPGEMHAGDSLKYRVALHNNGDRQLSMLSFEVKLVDAADTELCKDTCTITFDASDALPGSTWESDYLELTGFTENPGDNARVVVEVSRIHLHN